MILINIRFEVYYCSKADENVGVYAGRKPVREPGRVWLDVTRICINEKCRYVNNEEECPLENK